MRACRAWPPTLLCACLPSERSLVDMHRADPFGWHLFDQDEVKILQRLDNKHIIKIADVYETPEHLYLILEL